MPRIVICTFREKPKSYHLDAGDLALPVGTAVVAETDRGLEIGRVKWPVREQEAGSKTYSPVLRMATTEDIARDEHHRDLEKDALALMRESARTHKLPMKPVSAHCLLDRSRMILYYECEERVDFREMVRELASKLGMRVHLQGVSSREAARIVGGLGVCGQPLCCSTWLNELPPVTLKMAKEQHLGGAPSKISGACGRLMCCLRYEIEFYRDQNARLPRPGDPVDTASGPATVLEVNSLSEKCLVRYGDGRYQTLDAEDLRTARAQRGPVRACSNHISQGGSCGGAATGGCGGSCKSGGGCGTGGGCGSCGIKSLLRKKAASAVV